MSQKYYVASCFFTLMYPELSKKIQHYIGIRHNIQSVRCCMKNERIKEYAESNMSEPNKESWCALSNTARWQAGDIAYTICHNCSNIVEKANKGVKSVSLWELVLTDEQFEYPDYSGMQVTIQDCWRSKDRLDEQLAIRNLLEKMNIKYIELEENFHKTLFCGNSRYKTRPEEEQQQIMEDYCRKYKTKDVVCYCHYCIEGLQMGGVNGIHIAELLFGNGNYSVGVRHDGFPILE
nr:hypothetical protein [uncultured Clostridium sp.]